MRFFNNRIYRQNAAARLDAKRRGLPQPQLRYAAPQPPESGQLVTGQAAQLIALWRPQ